jgi:hypothetical protein
MCVSISERGQSTKIVFWSDFPYLIWQTVYFLLLEFLLIDIIFKGVAGKKCESKKKRKMRSLENPSRRKDTLWDIRSLSFSRLHVCCSLLLALHPSPPLSSACINLHVLPVLYHMCGFDGFNASSDWLDICYT